MLTAFYSDGCHNKYKKPVAALEFWQGNTLVSIPATPENFALMLQSCRDNKRITLKENSVLKSNYDPFFIYGDTYADLITDENGRPLYFVYDDSPHKEALLNKILSYDYTPTAFNYYVEKGAGKFYFKDIPECAYSGAGLQNIKDKCKGFLMIWDDGGTVLKPIYDMSGTSVYFPAETAGKTYRNSKWIND